MRRWINIITEAQEEPDEYQDRTQKYNIPYEGVLIGKALGATGYRQIRPGNTVPWEKGMGGAGYFLLFPDNRVFLDLSREKDTLWLSQIAVEEKGDGLGTKIMEAIRNFAKEKKLRVVVYKVTNPEFYRRFDWLTENNKDFIADFRP